MTRPTVLVVEDDQIARDIARLACAELGCAVTEAEDGEKALKLARKNVPDLILLDLALPGLDGWEVARRLRASARTREVPIVAVTAHVLKEGLDEALAAGVRECLLKPYRVRQLQDLVRKYLPET